MRYLAATVTVLALLATPVYAQMGMGGGGMGGGGGRHQKTNDKAAPAKPKVDEKAYKAALDKIPDSKEKFDPWGSLGVPDHAKKPK